MGHGVFARFGCLAVVLFCARCVCRSPSLLVATCEFPLSMRALGSLQFARQPTLLVASSFSKATVDFDRLSFVGSALANFAGRQDGVPVHVAQRDLVPALPAALVSALLVALLLGVFVSRALLATVSSCWSLASRLFGWFSS